MPCTRFTLFGLYRERCEVYQIIEWIGNGGGRDKGESIDGKGPRCNQTAASYYTP